MAEFRGSPSDIEGDGRATSAMLARAAADGVASVSIRTPPRRVVFGRRDTTRDGYDRARSIARANGFEPVERRVGGRAVAYTGRTLSFAVALPSAEPRTRIEPRYETATTAVVEALRATGADVSSGEPDATFCPGDHSVRITDGGKVAGIAQRVRADAALVAGCVIVSAADSAAIASVLDRVYRALDLPFDPSSVGSVADAGGPDDPSRVERVLEDALLDAPWGDGDADTADRGQQTRADDVHGW